MAISYAEGIDAIPGESHKKADLFSKRAAINLALGRLDDAKIDALASCTGGAGDWKAHYTAGRAAYGLREYGTSQEHLRRALDLNPAMLSVQRDLQRCLARASEERTGDFDFKQMFESVSPQSVHLDHATFTARTEIADSALHGQGVFAKEHIKAGDLVLCEKAIMMPNIYEPSRASAALYATTVRQLYENPSLAKSVLRLHGGDHVRSGCEGKIIDGVPVVDVWLVEAIRRKNCFSAPLSTREDTRPTTHGVSHTKGLWPYASHLNHSCVPNTVRSFIGDMLISRALRDIEPGEEIFHSYTNIKAHYGRRQAEFHGWGFQCTCELCQTEARSAQDNMARRTQLLAQIEKLANKKPPKNMVPDATIRTMERMTRELEEAHEPDVYGGLPRLMLIYPSMWLLEAYKGRKNHARVVATATRVLRNFGFEVKDEDDVADLFREPRDRPTVLTIHAVTTLRDTASAHVSMGMKGVGSRIEETAKFGYMLLTGFENDLSLMDGA